MQTGNSFMDSIRSKNVDKQQIHVIKRILLTFCNSNTLHNPMYYIQYENKHIKRKETRPIKQVQQKKQNKTKSKDIQ